MENLSEQLEDLITYSNELFLSCLSTQALDLAKAEIFGKQGKMTVLLRQLMKSDPEKRKVFGAAVNLAKKEIEKILNKQKKAIEERILHERLREEVLDVTLPGRRRKPGALHPVMETRVRIEKIFKSFLFEIADGPEIEDEWHNFTALNSPPDHPARSMQDTFYVNNCNGRNSKLSLLLRTHTSPMQIRFAKKRRPPFKVIIPGRTYRVDSDATHSPMFHQVEGLWVDEKVNFSNLKGLYKYFLREFFEREDIHIRFRPSYFPFTQPSAEVDMMFASGSNAGRWLEISGAGQVHPIVLCNMGLDPERYTGFAFGSGIERLAMLRYGVDDLRMFFSGDLRFISQFV